MTWVLHADLKYAVDFPVQQAVQLLKYQDIFFVVVGGSLRHALYDMMVVHSRSL